MIKTKKKLAWPVVFLVRMECDLFHSSARIKRENLFWCGPMPCQREKCQQCNLFDRYIVFKPDEKNQHVYFSSS